MEANSIVLAVRFAVGGLPVSLYRYREDRQPEEARGRLYGAGLTALFAVSATYHLRSWAPARSRVLRRLDHANIFVLITAKLVDEQLVHFGM